MANELIPSSTYRLQFNNHFTFQDAFKLVDYFHRLGISHLYASPLLQARKGSQHGYDVVNPNQLNSEIGSEYDFIQLIEKLKENKMGLILDIVPNHMAVGMENQMWKDVLENGSSSAYATFFDINWNPSKKKFKNKIFLPFLDKSFGQALENKQLCIMYDGGKFVLNCNDISLPTSLESWKDIVQPLYNEVSKLFLNQEKEKKLFSILQKINVNCEGALIAIKSDIENDLKTYFFEYQDVFNMLNKQLDVLNGINGNPSSFDNLEKFIDSQNYRLCYWKVANDEINYRRFFDVYEYVAIRIENKEAFEASHKKIFELLKFFDGLRIDHIDGLWDPQQYLENIRAAGNIPYLIVEKILTGNEKIRREWPVQGNVGYDFLNQLNSIFIFQENKDKFFEIYHNFTGVDTNTRDLKYECKKLLLNTSFASDINFLTFKLNNISAQMRYARDFTSENLKTALREIIACFPVYRSYIRAELSEIHEEDKKYIHAAIGRAKRINPLVDPSVYDFILNILLLHFNKEINEALQLECKDFVMHFQQVTGPVMAKGLEDTAFYRFFPLTSLNEVGGEIGIFGINLENFHKKNIERFSDFPYSMLTTTTHDTKRSEDVRARINVLSEIPELWEKAIKQWNGINQQYKVLIDDSLVPDANEEYLIYQTLIGTWPLDDLSEETYHQYTQRIQEFMEKAIKEAKLHSSWIDSNEPHHAAVKEFIVRILDIHSPNKFIDEFRCFIEKIISCGMLNSLAQLILKLTCPGVPDIYQGNEIWNFSLVDPDNRRIVDYELRQNYLNNTTALQSLIKFPENGKIKLYLTSQLLALRKKLAEVFNKGSYVELKVEGDLKDHLIAFSRYLPNKIVIVLVSRFYTFLMKDFQNYKYMANPWEYIFLNVPTEFTQKKYKNVFTQQNYVFESEKICLKEILEIMPFAVLESCP